MNKKTFILVLVYVAQAAQGQEDRDLDEDLKNNFYRYWNNDMGPNNFVDIKNESVDDVALVLKTLGLDPAVKTKIVIHGFTDSAANLWKTHNFAKAYYDAKKDVNLFIVDWSTISVSPYYNYAAGSVDEVGKWICNHLISALEKVKVKFEDIHVLGHSLGSHVAGNIGRCMKEKNGPQLAPSELGRITALDPAKPFFDLVYSTYLVKTDAKFVDVIHTNGGRLTQGCLGRTDKIGHVDFYPNKKTEKAVFGLFELDNQHQPGCWDPTYDSIADWAKEFVFDHVCSHAVVLDFYLESILNGKAFESRPCSKWEKLTGVFGFHVGNKCVKEGSLALYMGENIDIDKALNVKGDTRFFLTTTDGKNGTFSKDHFEL